MISTRIPVIALAGVAAAVTLAACSSSGGSKPADSSAPSTPALSTSAPSSAQAAGGAATAAKTMTVTETEFKIAMSTTSLTAGTYTLKVVNAGKITHALTVDGPGIEDKSTADLDGGKTATLTVTLAKGTYEFYCPVGNHKMEGMDEKVTVS